MFAQLMSFAHGVQRVITSLRHFLCCLVFVGDKPQFKSFEYDLNPKLIW